MVPAALAVAGTFAVMGWAGTPLGVATSMFAGMILGVGVDFAIHLVERYRLGSALGLGREAAIAEALAATGPAIVVNALAVALGFGVLVLSQVPANARLGGMTVICLLACLPPPRGAGSPPGHGGAPPPVRTWKTKRGLRGQPQSRHAGRTGELRAT
jgi:predicted RND superfamily exporter protein